MVVGVDQYKHIRKMAVEEGLSQREIARRLGISRNTVARYCKGEHMPWEAKDRGRKPSVVTGEVEDFIRSCLDRDKDPEVPRKQRHTARHTCRCNSLWVKPPRQTGEKPHSTCVEKGPGQTCSASGFAEAGT